MRVQPPVKHGFFWQAGQQYLALSEVPRTLNFTPSEVADAVALGELQIERVSDCKVVSMAALFDWIEKREGAK
ncbi:hypothetical protein [Marinobacter sp. F3R08]|uniref:hypothetical protein n=1 Tax=Marinobacter sp. F3R08 TaxID=2841559 RepID=UPI001C096679|nr:hypothetical protein [Marinobacter sp. F3R08]MBU2955077.1 hypothetical protein [Marinobacter sp. F3R08]